MHIPQNEGMLTSNRDIGSLSREKHMMELTSKSYLMVGQTYSGQRNLAIHTQPRKLSIGEV